jgi:ABC-2 type transport system permease protein
MSTNAALPVASVPAATRARDVLASEWVKLRSVRSTYLTLLAAAAATLATGVFAAAAVKTYHLDRVHFDPVLVSFQGLVIAQLAFGVFGALAMTSEHATGLIRTTYAAVPRRRAVLAAKAAVTGMTGLGAGELVAFSAFFAGQMALSGKHLSVSLGDPGVLRAVAGAGFYLAIVTLVGVGLGAIIRHTAGAVAAASCILIQPIIVNAIFPNPNSSAGDYVLWWAGQALISTRPHEAHYPSIATSLVVCLAYAAAALTAAALLVTRRDA